VLYYGPRSNSAAATGLPLFRERLRELGYVEGKNILIEDRYADGNSQRLEELARELVESRVDVIVASAQAATSAARHATGTIPIVMVYAGNPIGAGLIASLARPGGNVTGTANLPLGAKQVQLIREVAPGVAKLAVLANPTNAAAVPIIADITDAARSFGISVVEVSRGDDFPKAFAATRSARPDALMVLVEPMIGANGKQILDFAARFRLPTISDFGSMARLGGLMSYGPVFLDHYPLAADYVDKILKGVKPADLPVQQPAKFELVVNLKTATALGLTIPQAMLLRADEVIQ
jgi:putative ABC transport system substrate-binding protein